MSDIDSSSQDTISSPVEIPGESEYMSDGIKEPIDDDSNESSEDISIKRAFDGLLNEYLLKGFNEKEMHNVVAKLIEREKLNTMVIDLGNYEKGFAVSFHKYGTDEDITHGAYSYGVSVLDYIKDGEIPYELFDVIYNYGFKLFYDGYIACELRIHINGNESVPWNFFEKDVPSTVDDKEDIPSTVDDKEDVPSTVDDKEDVPSTVDDKEDVPSTVDDKEDVPSTVDDKEDVPSTVDDKEGVPSNFEKEDVPSSFVEQRSVRSYSDEQDVEQSYSDEQDVEQSYSEEQDVALPDSDEHDVESPDSDEQDVAPPDSDEEDVEPSYFDLKEGIRSHFVLLKHSIQTIDGECCMKMKKDQKPGEKIKSVEYDKERAKLIHHYSPDLCLDPDPVVAEILIANGLKQHSFITPHLKRVIQSEKEQIELMLKTSADNKPKSVPTKPEDDKKWRFRSKEPTEEEIKLSKLGSNMEVKSQMSSYLKVRKICFPDKDSFTGSHVEIENFVYEYEGITRAGEKADILDKLIISVIDDKEYYYGAYELDERMKNNAPSNWWDIGDRTSLDLYVEAITKEEIKLCCGTIKVTHNRMFDERVEFPDETAELREGEFFDERKMKITRQKLEVPISKVVLCMRVPVPKYKRMSKKK